MAKYGKIYSIKLGVKPKRIGDQYHGHDRLEQYLRDIHLHTTNKMKKIFSIIFFLSALIASSTVAQERKNSGWTMTMNTIQISPKIIIQFDAQLRSSNKIKQPEVLILRPVLGYMINKSTSVGLGIATISSWKSIDDVRDRTDEFRLWQQYNTVKKYGVATLQHRLRMEERWMPVVVTENGEFKKTGTNISSRFRYFTRLMLPVKKTAQFSKGVFWALQNEFFFNTTGAVHLNNKFFDQTRTYGGLGFRLNKHADLEFGYMHQYLEGKSKKYTNNHIVQLSSFLRF